ncbi:MAG: PD40 domain-containing protein [Acidobacteriia bacterium]|nr:PD40 domain-containing protein [Terriglobia bacterium]
MRTLRIAITVAAAVVLLVTASAQSLEVDLQRASQKETVTGDLKAAIEEYRKIAAQAGSNRKVAANALVHMAECYQKLGDAEARKIFERVVRDYADQKDAVAIARARLGLAGKGGQPAGIVARQVWTAPPGGDIYGAVSSDGRMIPYVNWTEFGDLFMHDLATNADRRLTNTASDGKVGVPGEYAEESSFSRDGKQLAYSWFKGKDRRYEIRIIDLQGTGVPQPRRLFDNEDISWISPDDWSPDGKWLAVQLHRKDRSAQIGLVGVEDGSLRVLKSVDWRGPTRLSFSSDGKYIAFDLPASESTEQRDVFLLAVDGSREIPVVTHPSHDALAGWSPDGKHLLFASDRGGSMGLWAIRFADGKVQGTPELVKPDAGRQNFMGLAAPGKLYSAQFHSGGPDIRVAGFDFAAGKFLSPPVSLIDTFVGSNQSPDWSPDGKYVAYVSLRGTTGSRYFVLGIRTVATGAVRELALSPGFSLLQSLRWAPDGRSLVVGGRDIKGRDGVFSVDAQTGQSTLLLPREGGDGPGFPAWAPDGKKLYFRGRVVVGEREEFAFFEWDPASGVRRELIRLPNLGFMFLSPDGRYIATATRAFDPSIKTSSVLLVPVAGGEPKELARVEQPQTVAVGGWAPDSRSLVFTKGSGRRPFTSQSEFWITSLDGQSRKLDVGFDGNFGPFRVHPDGRQIMFGVSGPRKPAEVWVLENFLTTLSAKK